MAFLKNHTLRGGIIIASAYHRIAEFTFDDHTATAEMRIEVAIYRDRAARDQDKGNYTQKATIILSSQDIRDVLAAHPAGAPPNVRDSILTAIYVKLRQYPQYIDAVDV